MAGEQGVEPWSSVLETDALPLSYTSIIFQSLSTQKPSTLAHALARFLQQKRNYIQNDYFLSIGIHAIPPLYSNVGRYYTDLSANSDMTHQ